MADAWPCPALICSVVTCCMPRKSSTAVAPPVPAGYIPAANIPLDDINDLFLAVDERGTAYCYLGYWPSEDRNREDFYRISVAARD